MRLFQNRRYCVRWAHHDNRLRLRCANRIDGASHIRGLPFVGRDFHRLRAARLECLFDASQHGSAERIFRVDDADVVIAELVPDAIHLLARFVVVGSAHVDDPVAHWCVQRLGSGEQADDGDFVALGERHVLYRGRSAHEESQGENLVVHQAVEASFGFRRVVTVVVSD